MLQLLPAFLLLPPPLRIQEGWAEGPSTSGYWPPLPPSQDPQTAPPISSLHTTLSSSRIPALTAEVWPVAAESPPAQLNPMGTPTGQGVSFLNICWHFPSCAAALSPRLVFPLLRGMVFILPTISLKDCSTLAPQPHAPLITHPSIFGLLSACMSVGGGFEL